MTDAEWDACVLVLTANWDHSTPSEISLRKRRVDLDDFAGEQVIVAIEALYRDGERYMPNGAAIRAKLLDLTLDLPDWPQALRALKRIASTRFFYPPGQGGPDAAEREEILERTLDAQLLPVIRGFGKESGWSQIQLGLSGDGGDEARLRDKYNAYVRRGTRELSYRGLAPAGLPALERIAGSNGAPRQIGDVVKELTR